MFGYFVTCKRTLQALRNKSWIRDPGVKKVPDPGSRSAHWFNMGGKPAGHKLPRVVHICCPGNEAVKMGMWAGWTGPQTKGSSWCIRFTAWTERTKYRCRGKSQKLAELRNFLTRFKGRSIIYTLTVILTPTCLAMNTF